MMLVKSYRRLVSYLQSRIDCSNLSLPNAMTDSYLQRVLLHPEILRHLTPYFSANSRLDNKAKAHHLLPVAVSALQVTATMILVLILIIINKKILFCLVLS